MPILLVLFLLALVVLGGAETKRPDTETRSIESATVAEIDTARELAKAFSKDTFFWIEGPDLPHLLKQGPAHPLLKAFEKSPLGTRVLRDEEGDPFTLGQLVRYAKGELGFDPLQALANATSRGVALGIEAGRGDVSWTLVARAAQEKDAEDAVRRLRNLFADEFAIARFGKSLVLSDQRESLDRAIARLRQGSEDPLVPSLADDPRFDEALQRAESTPLLRAFVDLNRLEAFAANADEGDGLTEIRALAENAGAHLLLGSEVALRMPSRTSLFAELHIQERSLTLRVEALGSATDHEAVHDIEVQLPSPSAGDVVRGVLHRDIESLFASRSELFDPEALAGFNEFADNAALFLGGADFERDVLPGVSKSIGLIAREVSYAEGPRPQIPLPGLALIFELQDPEHLGPHLSSAFQSSVALVSIDRAQEGQPPLLLDLELVDGVPMTSARFLPPFDGEVVDVRFNLEPACARAGDLFILGTHADVVRSVIRDLRQGRIETRTIAGGSTFLQLEGPAAADLMEANLETLAMNQVLDEGVTMDQALEEFGIALEFVRSLESVELSSSIQSSQRGNDSIQLRLSLNLYATGAPQTRPR